MYIPFYSNSEDDLHCLQACLRMALKYWLPEQEFNFGKLDRLSGNKPNKWTWDSRSMLWLLNHGFHVQKITPFDYKLFAADGKNYLQRLWNPEVYKRQDEMSNLRNEQALAKRLKKDTKMRFIRRSPRTSDLSKLLNDGYVLIAHINPRVLDNLPGYSNHSVVITGLEPKEVVFHDPGLPAEKYRHVARNKFDQALKELLAIKLPL